MSLHTIPPDLAESRRLWFLFFLMGALLFVAGFVAMIYSTTAATVSILIWGWVLIVRGALEAGFSIWARRFSASLLDLLLGVVGIVIGLLIIANPDKALDVLALLLAAFLLIGGLLQAVVALFVHFPGWFYSLTSGLVGIVFGLFIWWHWPDDSDWFIGVCARLLSILSGLAKKEPSWCNEGSGPH
jgi:uncharacterized membrane protein HdeD (DUF308 family)